MNTDTYTMWESICILVNAKEELSLPNREITSMYINKNITADRFDQPFSKTNIIVKM